MSAAMVSTALIAIFIGTLFRSYAVIVQLATALTIVTGLVS